MNKLVLMLLLYIVTCQLSAQENYGIKIPNPLEYEDTRFCSRINSIFYNKSKEISFGVQLDSKNSLYFQFNNKEWFKSLFQNIKDGIAIDVITKDQFDCEYIILPDEIRGETLKPIYKNNLIKSIETVQEGWYQVLVGVLPAKFNDKEIEFNIMMLSDGFLCRYQTTYNLQSYNYELLDMGLYLDSITYNRDYQNINPLDGSITKYKTLKFKIPFKKNKTTLSIADIKPLYDSLLITDFNVKKIDIKAYSSVEGSAQRNQQLQKQRANSIIRALQTFQKPTIETIVSTSENWVEFLNDIKNTKYAHLKTLSKSKVKEKLANGMAAELEKYLQHHRKALITLYLDKIDYYQEFSGEQLLQKFNKAISDKNLTEAERIQNSLFERMKMKTVNPEMLFNLKIPKQNKFVDILNANTVYRYQLNENKLLNSYYDLQELNKLIPNNKKISYNLLALQLKMNHNFRAIPDHEKLLANIHALKKLGIEHSLVQRMLVNYHILNAQLLMKKGAYEEKDKSVQFILNTYKSLLLSDNDYLSLAQFVTYYYDHYSAIELLQEKVNKIEVNKRLLFYYLNLTLIDEELTKDPDYRTIMLNAINLDEKRFCKLFDSSEKGGVTFQLLKNDYLRDTYCENCLN